MIRNVLPPFLWFTVYNTYYAVLTGCEDCQMAYVGECVKHRLQPVTDKVILSRAWASLPLVLQIFRLSETADAQNAGQTTSPHRNRH